ncbi:MAG: hypothetical protein V4773_27260 [Verrucomicrobiota bacterium]
MSSSVESSVASVLSAEALRARSEKRRKWRLFGWGVVIRLLGLALIWLGDGHDNVFRKALVVTGVVLSIGGITVLRYLLISGFRKRK